MSAELVELIVHLGREDRSWGCARIQGELAKLGARVGATSVRRVFRSHGLGPAEWRQNLDQGFELALRSPRRSTSDLAFSLVYLGLCRLLALVTSCHRRDVDKDLELVVLRHQV
jgi:hypothetical protein